MEEEAEAFSSFRPPEEEEEEVFSSFLPPEEEEDFWCFPLEGEPGGESCFLFWEEEEEEEEDVFSFDSFGGVFDLGGEDFLGDRLESFVVGGEDFFGDAFFTGSSIFVVPPVPSPRTSGAGSHPPRHGVPPRNVSPEYRDAGVTALGKSAQ